jgi:hypothetical protein
MNTLSRSVVFLFLSAFFSTLFFGCQSNSETSEKKPDTASFDFVESSTGLPDTGRWRHGIDFFDINLDGHLDVLAPPPRYASGEAARPHVWLGNGKGDWSSAPPQVPTTLAYNYGGIAGGDYNGDGIPDMALAMHVKPLACLKGLGDGRYAAFSEGLPATQNDFSSRALVSADFNNDGTADFAAASEVAWRGENDGHMPGAIICLGSSKGFRCRLIADEKKMDGFFSDQIVTGDVNGDGNVDIGLASLQHNLDLIVWLGDGKGGFTPFNNGLPTELHYLSVALADMNQDGRDDLVASISGFGTKGMRVLKVYLSGDDGFKDMSSGLPDKEAFYAVAAGDLDGDGIKEIFAGTRSGGLKVFSLEKGVWKQAATPALPETGLATIYGAYCVDLNGDGLDDVAFNYANGKSGAGGIRVFLSVPRTSK